MNRRLAFLTYDPSIAQAACGCVAVPREGKLAAFVCNYFSSARRGTFPSAIERFH